ncbi:CcdB-like toxin protein [Alcanivorax xiamenensis]|uniref:Toxin CcdB n=1 Tax=Alcanivorax xiamenensis TaxID=1177156 RepID=A0ABQ6Y7V7_9GAMM|nr:MULTISPECIES: CcdB family protein [Alcanivorax]KAF0805237.1 CcdB-like toxin protein [Alcanivorax xiamenensis]
MAQFDVYRNPSNTSSTLYPYLVDIQSPILEDLATRIVIPLARRSAFGDQPMRGLTPEIHFEDEVLLLLTPQISSLPVKRLDAPVGSLAHFRENIIAALDFAVTGI